MTLKLENIAKTFSEGSQRLEILNALSLEVAEGQIVAIIGASGSGKSTLLSILAGFDQPERGEIFWDKRSTSAWSDTEWARFRRQNLGFVFQSYHLIPYLTAVENVALPCRLLNEQNATARARAALEELGLKNRAEHLPRQLSGGESQRVAIARALVHAPGLILADEPTGSLDVETGKIVLDLLFQRLRARGQTALIVTHAPEVAARCDRTLTLKDKRLW